MRSESWLGRVVATAARRTPAYRAAGVRGFPRRSDSWLGRVVATAARQTPAYRDAGPSTPPAAGRSGTGTVGIEIDKALVRDAARAVVARIAPAELTTFRAVSERYFTRSGWALAVSRGGGWVGFGPARRVVRMTPVALVAAADVVRYLVDQLARPDAAGGRSAAARTVRRLLGLDGGHPEPSGQPLPELTQAQLAEVRSIVADAARRHGMSEERARLIADVIVSELTRDNGGEP